MKYSYATNNSITRKNVENVLETRKNLIECSNNLYNENDWLQTIGHFFNSLNEFYLWLRQEIMTCFEWHTCRFIWMKDIEPLLWQEKQIFAFAYISIIIMLAYSIATALFILRPKLFTFWTGFVLTVACCTSGHKIQTEDMLLFYFVAFCFMYTHNKWQATISDKTKLYSTKEKTKRYRSTLLKLQAQAVILYNLFVFIKTNFSVISKKLLLYKTCTKFIISKLAKLMPEITLIVIVTATALLYTKSTYRKQIPVQIKKIVPESALILMAIIITRISLQPEFPLYKTQIHIAKTKLISLFYKTKTTTSVLYKTKLLILYKLAIYMPEFTLFSTIALTLRTKLLLHTTTFYLFKLALIIFIMAPLQTNLLFQKIPIYLPESAILTFIAKTCYIKLLLYKIKTFFLTLGKIFIFYILTRRIKSLMQWSITVILNTLVIESLHLTKKSLHKTIKKTVPKLILFLLTTLLLQATLATHIREELFTYIIRNNLPELMIMTIINTTIQTKIKIIALKKLLPNLISLLISTIVIRKIKSVIQWSIAAICLFTIVTILKHNPKTELQYLQVIIITKTKEVLITVNSYIK